MNRALILAMTLLPVSLAAPPTPVFTDSSVTLLGVPSLDGRVVSLVEQGDLAIRDTATGKSTKLTKAAGKEFAYFSSISRDSKTIAYAWFNEEGFYELRAIPLTGGQPRTLFKNPEAGFVQPTAWTPDNRFILTLLFRKDNVSQIALIPASGDGEVRILRSLNWVYPKRMDISPDGQTLLYDSFAPASTSLRTIYSLSLDGAIEKQLVTEPGNHVFPLFAPDGKSFYYLSNNDLVQRPLDGPAKVIAKDLGRALPLGITNRNVLYYGLRAGSSDVFLAGIADIVKTARRVSIHFPNRNLAPSFSPDGKRLAYLSRRGTENFGQESRALVIRDLTSDEETEQPVKMAHLERVHWRPDGQALYIAGSDGRGRGGIFEFDIAAKRTRPVIAEIGGPPKGYEFYPQGNGFVYRDGEEFRDQNRQPAEWKGKRDGVTEWLSPECAIRGSVLVKFTAEGERHYELPGNRQPGAAISPDGKTIALTAGRESQQIWSLPLP